MKTVFLVAVYRKLLNFVINITIINKIFVLQITSSMQRVLSMWNRWKNGPTRWQTNRNCSSVFTTGFNLSLMKLQRMNRFNPQLSRKHCNQHQLISISHWQISVHFWNKQLYYIPQWQTHIQTTLLLAGVVMWPENGMRQNGQEPMVETDELWSTLRFLQTFATFKPHLKTYLFNQSYSQVSLLLRDWLQSRALLCAL